MRIKRGDLVWVNLDPTKGSEQAGRRPVLVIQNDVGNAVAPTVIVAPLTTKSFTKPYPINVHVPRGVAGLKQDSTVLLSQIRTIDKSRLERKSGHLPPSYLQQVHHAICISLGLTL
ncbi:MAG: type II toxin-antitoxin system PemK/MazF family toxin [Candidatus Omnitrophica bacterium]|nr:type II toxin-antitoxin system PemK/MazF family toxin [Candidatus Omnitrophota bacterium]